MSVLGLTVRLLLSQQGGGGPTVHNVLLNYAATMSIHDIVASKHPMEVMVQAACSAIFSIPKPPCGICDGQQCEPRLRGRHVGPYQSLCIKVGRALHRLRPLYIKLGAFVRKSRDFRATDATATLAEAFRGL